MTAQAEALKRALELAHEGVEIHSPNSPEYKVCAALIALAQPAQEQNLKLMPREATPEMLKAMDECSTEGYDERLYEGHAGSVYMAAWDAFYGQHCYCGDITNLGVIHRDDGPCHYPEHKESKPEQDKERCVGCEACIDTACGRDECPKGWPKAAQPEQEPVAWVPYLSDRADGVKGRYAIARWNPRGYREVWNLRRHEWGAYSDDVLSLEEADTLLRLITIPTRKVTSPQPPQPKEPEQEPVAWRVSYPDEPELGFWFAEGIGGEGCLNEPLYTTPPPVAEPHKRKPLTDEQIDSIADKFTVHTGDMWEPELCIEFNDSCKSVHSFARAIEAAHGIKEKNT